MQKTSKQSGRAAFTLVEAMAGLLILSLMLGGLMVAYSRTTEAIVKQSFQERAASVAQRRLELLLATRQEPDSTGLQGRDEQDPEFLWEMSLRRVSVGGQLPKPDLSNTVIEAEVKVTYEGLEETYSSFEETDGGFAGTTAPPPFTMTRYFSILKPLPGHSIAVPLQNVEEDPQWYLDLKQRLGRDPTSDESLEEMNRLGLLPEGVMEMLRDTTIEEK